MNFYTRSLSSALIDWEIENASLHLSTPHRSLLEMLRVARNSIIAFEARDCALMGLAQRSGQPSDHDLDPAFLSGGIGFEFRATPILNYVSSWTESEMREEVYGTLGARNHSFTFSFDQCVPVQHFRMASSQVLRLAGLGLKVLTPLLAFLLGKQNNSFGFMVLEDTRLRPWMRLNTEDTPVPDIDFLASRYDKSKYSDRL